MLVGVNMLSKNVLKEEDASNKSLKKVLSTSLPCTTCCGVECVKPTKLFILVDNDSFVMNPLKFKVSGWLSNNIEFSRFSNPIKLSLFSELNKKFVKLYIIIIR